MPTKTAAAQENQRRDSDDHVEVAVMTEKGYLVWVDEYLAHIGDQLRKEQPTAAYCTLRAVRKSIQNRIGRM